MNVAAATSNEKGPRITVSAAAHVAFKPVFSSRAAVARYNEYVHVRANLTVSTGTLVTQVVWRGQASGARVGAVGRPFTPIHLMWTVCRRSRLRSPGN
jgi:hypothetical protein